ncbi:MAG TPA: nicotinamide riboside transporter PnuC [Candidatus Nanoarchaeia archaeon]|nr:nicotinamide riboside transporter PnuC [Candidatus Nanoarchaeia archaeon]
MVSIREYLREWTTFERVWLFSFTAINIYLFFAWGDTWIGLTASISGMLCVVLTAKGKISSFYWGLINIFAYSYVAWQSKYYGDVGLNMLYFLPMAFVGIYFWKKNYKKINICERVIVRSMTWKQKAWVLVASLVALYILGMLLRAVSGTLPFIDSTTTIFSIVATILLTKRYSDQWFYWIMVDIWSIVMWLYIFMRDGNQVSMLVMWSAFLVNAVYGYYNWRKMEKAQKGVGK